MNAIVAIIAMLLGILNFFGGIVGGVWLAYLGEWRAIGAGILIAICAPLPLGLAMTPGGLLFGSIAASFLGKGRALIALPFVLCAQIYLQAVIGAWFLFVFWYFRGFVHATNVWPMLFWIYSTAVAPLSYMAQKEVQAGGGDGEAITLFFAQLALVCTVVAQLAGIADPKILLYVFAGILLLSAVIQTLLASLSVIGTQRLPSSRPPDDWLQELRR